MSDGSLAGRIRAILTRIFGRRLGYRPERHYMRGSAVRSPPGAPVGGNDNVGGGRTDVDPRPSVGQRRSDRSSSDLR